MTRERVGFRTWIYQFRLSENDRYHERMESAKSCGEVTQIFVNNGYAFEIRFNMRG